MAGVTDDFRFFQKLLHFWELLKQEFLQAGCPSCHPTNSVKALVETLGSTVFDILRRHTDTRAYSKLVQLQVVHTCMHISPGETEFASCWLDFPITFTPKAS